MVVAPRPVGPPPFFAGRAAAINCQYDMVQIGKWMQGLRFAIGN
jgi:hypothetical protein